MQIMDDVRHQHAQTQQAGTGKEPIKIELDIFQKFLDSVRALVDQQKLSNNLLSDMNVYFREGPPPAEAHDIFRTITLYKPGFGSNWLLNKEHRQYCRVYAPVSTAVSISSSIGPAFLVTIPAPTMPGLWNAFDFDDQASIYLDSTASANQMNIKVRLTNVPNLY